VAKDKDWRIVYGGLPYYAYSQHLKEVYGEKVYKIPASLPVTCPNRDGTIGRGGCTFCGDIGAGYENKLANEELKSQLLAHKEHIQKKYKAKKFIPYFQNFSNTFLQAQDLARYLEEALFDGVVEIALSTRPDCIDDEIIEVLANFQKKHKVTVTVELGLQTINYRTLEKINRGHGISEFVDAVWKLGQAKIDICAHVILNLPGDERIDIVETAKFLAAFPPVTQVKLHALYIVKGTKMAEEYLNGEIKLGSSIEYMERVILFLEHIRPDMVVQRIIGRAPAEHTLTANWDTGWWKIRDDIIGMMTDRGTSQGSKCKHLNGSARKKANF
jgi:radical SAM protein (TIGR01212 family)